MYKKSSKHGKVKGQESPQHSQILVSKQQSVPPIHLNRHIYTYMHEKETKKIAETSKEERKDILLIAPKQRAAKNEKTT